METPTTGTPTLVEAARAAAERSKQWVADKSGIPISTFNRKLAGHSDFTVNEIARIAQALGVRPSTLLPDVFREVA